MEQQAADYEQWEREYELEERKRQDANRRFELEQERENSQTQTGTYQPDHWAMIAHYQKLGQNNQSKETAEEPEYDNGNVSEGDIKTMQRVLGLEETGKWTDLERTGAGGLSADDAWKDYQQGKLQNRKSIGLGDQGLANGNVKAMERMLGLKEDGYWSEEDSKAAGGLSEVNAWEAYQRGLLRKRNTQVNNKVLTKGDIKSMERVLGLKEDGIWSAEDQKAAKGFSAATAWEAYQSGALQRWKSKGLFEQGLSTDSVKTKDSSTNTQHKPYPSKTEDNNLPLTKQDAQREAAMVGWEYNRLSALLDRYKNLTRWEQNAAGNAEIARIAAVYGSVTDLEEMVTALRNQRYYLDNALRFNYLFENADFAELSRLDPSVVDRTYLAVNEPTKVRRWENAAYLSGTSMVYNALNYDNLHLMEDEERAIFNYLYAKDGEKAAKEYLEYLEYTLNERSMNNAMQWVSARTQDIPFLSQTVASQLSTPIALLGGTGLVDVAGQKLRNTVTGDYKPIDYNRDAMTFSKASGTIRGTVAQDITDATGVIDLNEEEYPVLSQILNGKSLADIYQMGMGVQDSAAVAALTVINPVLGKVGSVLLSGSAATQTMLDAVERGATDDQALAIGIISGCIEMLFEEIELNSLLKTDSKHLKEICDRALNGVVGGSVTEFTNLAADYLIMARNSGYERNIRHYLEVNSGWSYEQAEKQALIDSALQIVGAGIGGTIESLVLPSKKDDRKN